jgi:hypothetical protein
VPVESCRDVEIGSRLGNQADTRSPILAGQAIDHVTRGTRAARISAVLGKSFLSDDQVRVRYRNLTRFFGDAVPESLKVANLIRLGEGTEPGGLDREARLALSAAVAWSRSHALTLSTEPIECQRAGKHTGVPAADLPRRHAPLTQLDPIAHFAALARSVMVRGAGLDVVYLAALRAGADRHGAGGIQRVAVQGAAELAAVANVRCWAEGHP